MIFSVISMVGVLVGIRVVESGAVGGMVVEEVNGAVGGEEREGRREWFRAMTRMVGVSQSWAALYPCAEPKCEAAEKPLPRLFRCLSDG